MYKRFLESKHRILSFFNSEIFIGFCNFVKTFYDACLPLSHKCSAVTDASSPFEAELAALSIASRPGDKNGHFVMDPLAVELIQRHARQQCGRLGKKFKFLQAL